MNTPADKAHLRRVMHEVMEVAAKYDLAASVCLASRAGAAFGTRFAEDSVLKPAGRPGGAPLESEEYVLSVPEDRDQATREITATFRALSSVSSAMRQGSDLMDRLLDATRKRLQEHGITVQIGEPTSETALHFNSRTDPTLN